MCRPAQTRSAVARPSTATAVCLRRRAGADFAAPSPFSCLQTSYRPPLATYRPIIRRRVCELAHRQSVGPARFAAAYESSCPRDVANSALSLLSRGRQCRARLKLLAILRVHILKIKIGAKLRHRLRRGRIRRQQQLHHRRQPPVKIARRPFRPCANFEPGRPHRRDIHRRQRQHRHSASHARRNLLIMTRRARRLVTRRQLHFARRIFNMAACTIKRLLLLRKMFVAVRRMVERNPRPPLIRPNPKIGMVRRETLISLLDGTTGKPHCQSPSGQPAPHDARDDKPNKQSNLATCWEGQGKWLPLSLSVAEASRTPLSVTRCNNSAGTLCAASASSVEIVFA